MVRIRQIVERVDGSVGLEGGCIMIYGGGYLGMSVIGQMLGITESYLRHGWVPCWETVADDSQFIFFANVLPGIGEHTSNIKARN